MGMYLKKFRAPTLQQAIELIRNDLGDGAIILQTEPIKSKGFFKKEAIEVTAAIERKKLAPQFHLKVDADKKERALAQGKKANRNKIFGFFMKQAKKQAALPKKAPARAPKEVLESVEPKKAVLAPKEAPSMGELYAMKTFIEPLQKEVQQLKRSFRVMPQKEEVRIQPTPQTTALQDQIQSLRSELTDFIAEKRFEKTNLPNDSRRLMQIWSNRGVSTHEVASFLKQIHQWDKADGKIIRSVLEKRVAEANVFQRKSKRIVVLVGPTGVGKTTTLAKLAAYEKFKLKRSVAMISVDNVKIGGTDQLAHYSRILEIPFLRVSPEHSLEKICQFKTVDTILVDTFGISAHDDARIAKLNRELKILNPELASRVETHLVLPVSMPPCDIRNTLSGYSRLNPQYLIFTKWDETENWGGMLMAILETQKPVSFLCHGQNVPDDLGLFSKEKFIETITTIH